MPVHMAMEQPHPRIIRAEPHHRVPARRQDPRVAAHRHGRHTWRVRRRPVAVRHARHQLRLVPVDVHWVQPVVEIVHDDLDQRAGLQDERVRVDAIYHGVLGGGAGRHDAVQRGYLLRDVCDVVEARAVLFVLREEAEVQHDGLVRRAGEQRLMVQRHEREVVDDVEVLDDGRRRQRCGRVVDQVACGVVVQVGRGVVVGALVHGGQEGEVLGGVGFGLDEDVVALRGGHIDAGDGARLDIDAVNGDDGHLMLVKGHVGL